MVLTTQIQSRKQRRKEERKRKRKAGKHHVDSEEQDGEVPTSAKFETKTKMKDREDSSKKRKQPKSDDSYAGMNPDLAAALRRDEEEIADLEAKLGLKKSKSGKDKLNKEYAKLEGYGDDFGDFLDDLDNIVHRINNRTSEKDEESEEEVGKTEKVTKGNRKEKAERGDRYSKFEPDVASALRRDDDEIEDLERKLGFKKKKDRKKLHTEYAKLEGFGDDFGEFLDGLDDVMKRVTNPNDHDGMYEDSRSAKRARMDGDDDGDSSDEEEIVPMKDLDDESSDDEEIVPMKDPYEELDEDDSVLDELEAMKAQEAEQRSEEYDQSESESEDEEDEERKSKEEKEESDGSDSEESQSTGEEEPDHDVADTYTPTAGEDIYGNKVDGSSGAGEKPKKYVPPHLRKAQEDDKDDEEKLRMIRRSLNNAMNRLSEDTLISVAQQASKIYSGHPTQLVLKVMWKNTKDACVAPPMLMKGLIPVYVACIVGTHIQTGDTVQIAEYLLEMVVMDLWDYLKSFRSKAAEGGTENDSGELEKKQSCNLMLILCYLYNYGVVHCSFMYDIVRHLIENFSEADIECLLLLLCHCGRSLRSDDPLALKEIVLLVQKTKKSHESKLESSSSSSRAEYMLSAIIDLKNNKRSKQDDVLAEKTSKLRKLLGRIKSSPSAKKKSDSSLRISLQDILAAETKGRWWKVGASWVGNQYRFDDDNSSKQKESEKEAEPSSEKSEQDEALLRLASKYRMNTDRKRAIFCIIMSGADCDDTFEKLCRGSMLQNRSERDTVRVLLACCEGEKSYNKFYGHLANRICEYQPQCKFSFQLAFWDAFKQFKGMPTRKAANLAKLLFHLVATHQALRLVPVIKAIDIDEDMEEAGLIFLTILLTDIFEYYDDPLLVKSLFASSSEKKLNEEQAEQEEGFRASLLVFLMETLKNSPKNKKGSKFKKNFKAVVKTLDTDGFESMF